MLKVFFLGLIFIFGLHIGSFLNCVIYRLEWKKSFLKGRSFCPKCKQILQWYDLVPVLSFAFLKGRCRYCKNKISWQYPIVEISTGLIFLLIFNGSPILTTSGFQWFGFAHHSELAEGFSIFEHSNIIELFYLFIIASLLIIIFVYDLKHYIIPGQVVYPAIGLVFIFRILNLFENWKLKIENLPALFNILTVGLAAAGFFFIIWLASKGRAMGFGDVILSFFMGIFLSFPNILAGLLTAFFSGSLVGLALMSCGKKTLKSAVPFGPFLVLGTFIGLFWGESIIRWYLGFLF